MHHLIGHCEIIVLLGSPQGYMSRIFKFLELEEPADWHDIITQQHANENHVVHEPIFPETEQLLRDFHRPFNNLLAKMVGDEGYRWDVPNGTFPLHEHQLKQYEEKKAMPQSADPHSASVNRKKAVMAAALARRRAEEGGGGGRTAGAPEHHSRPNALDQHGISRHMKAPTSHGDTHSTSSSHSSSSSSHLRGEDYKRSPKAFAIDDLPSGPSDQINPWLIEGEFVSTTAPENAVDAREQLGYAAFAMDIPALKHLLYDIGVPGNLKDPIDSRGAFHSLAMIGTMSESHHKSSIYDLLKGKKSWLNEYMDPPLPLKLASVHALDITESLNGAILNAAQWLLRGGAEVNAVDRHRNTPLHYASYYGLAGLVEFLIDNGANPNVVNNEHRSPIHYAAAIGRAKICGLLIKGGADVDARDGFGVSAMDIFSQPGPITPEDALEFLDITQRAPRAIDRLSHPELEPEDKEKGWAGGSGGWGTERLEGFEDDMQCDVDQYW